MVTMILFAALVAVPKVGDADALRSFPASPVWSAASLHPCPSVLTDGDANKAQSLRCMRASSFAALTGHPPHRNWAKRRFAYVNPA